MIEQPKPKADVLARRDEIIAGLQALLPASGVISEPLRLKPYETDGLSAYTQVPLAVVLPETTEQVAAVLAFLHRNGVRVIPRGAGTGLAGGALFVVVASIAGEDGLLTGHSVQIIVVAAVYDAVLAALVFPIGRWAAHDTDTMRL